MRGRIGLGVFQVTDAMKAGKEPGMIPRKAEVPHLIAQSGRRG